jgi:hypothetical protein
MTKLLNTVFMLTVAAAAALPTTARGQGAGATAVQGKAPSARVAAAEIEVRAKVVELDMARRQAVLAGPAGNIALVDVPAEVKNFDQVRAGDEVVVRYTMAVAAKLEATKGAGIRERVESTTAAVAAPGAMPGAGAQRTVEVLASVQAIDRKAGTVTLRGAKRTVTVAAPADIDLSKLKVGNEVRAVIVEAVVLKVDPVAAK